MEVANNLLFELLFRVIYPLLALWAVDDVANFILLLNLFAGKTNTLVVVKLLSAVLALNNLSVSHNGLIINFEF